MKATASNQRLTTSAEVSSEPFVTAFRRLKEDAGVSYREISDGLRERGVPVSGGQLGGVANGWSNPSPRTMQAIADFFDVPPTYFTEFRLFQIRSLFDETRGFEAARAMADALPEQLLDVAGEIDIVALAKVGGRGGTRSRRPSRRD